MGWSEEMEYERNAKVVGNEDVYAFKTTSSTNIWNHIQCKPPTLNRLMFQTQFFGLNDERRIRISWKKLNFRNRISNEVNLLDVKGV